MTKTDAQSPPALYPADAAWWPTPAARDRARARLKEFPPESFATFEDFFFFIHIHPHNRAVHVIGMLTGLPIFGIAAWLLVGASWLSLPLFLFGHLFFTGFGIAGHVLYDGTYGDRILRANFLKAFPWVIRINLDTLRGRYQTRLRDFVEHYPFVVKAWDLQER